MSTNLLPCRRAVTLLHQRPSCRSNAVSSSVLSIRNKSTVSRLRPRGQIQIAGVRLQDAQPEFFSSKRQYRDINLQAEGSPADLSCLRPPVLEYVEQPKPGEDGRVAVVQRLKYWQGLASTHYRFYKAGVLRVWQNNKERRKILERLGPKWRRPELLHVCAMLGREREPRDGAPPKLTRKEYQLCLRTRSDIHRLIPFAIVLTVFGEWTPLVMPLAFIPEVCHRPNDQIKTVQRWCKRREYFNSKCDEKIDLIASEAGKEQPIRTAKVVSYRHLLWGYAADATFWIKFLPYIPSRWTNFFLTRRGPLFVARHNEILADTVLIMREGGFGKLSAEDICEYCMKCGSARFYVEAKLALHNGVHPATEAMRKRMVPILEQHAKRMLNADWTRLSPDLWWLQEYHVRGGGDPAAPDMWLKLN